MNTFVRHYTPAVILTTLIVALSATALPAQSVPPTTESCFIENRGQWNAAARFLSRGPGLDLWVTDQGLLYDLHRMEGATAGRREGRVVAMKFEESGNGKSRGIMPMPGVHHYLLGNDPARHRSDVPLFASVIMEDVTPGVSMRLYYETGRPRYDLIVAPGIDPASIRITYEGADQVIVTPDNELAVYAEGRELFRHTGLYAYQTVNGKQVEVECAFVPAGRGAAFRVGAYDHTRPLTIDPIIFASFLGGTSSETALDVAFDESGTLYICGTTSSTTFPTTTGAYSRNLTDIFDVFVTALDADTGTPLFSTYIGGDRLEEGRSMALGEEGTVYLCGVTDSDNFPTTEGAYNGTHEGEDDAFVLKLAADGGSLIYSTFIGGSQNDEANALAVGTNGTVHFCGASRSNNFPTTEGAYDEEYHDRFDAFAARLSADGSSLIFSTFLGGREDDYGYGIAVDGEGTTYICGRADTVDFPTTAGAFRTSHGGGTDGFVARLSTDGSDLLFSTFIGGFRDDWVNDLALGADGSIYFCGYTLSDNFPITPDIFSEQAQGNSDGFVARLTAQGNQLIFSTFLGGTDGDNATGIALDDDGNIYVCGGTFSTGFPVTWWGDELALKGNSDAFVTVFLPDASDLHYSSFIGGAEVDYANNLALGPDGVVAICGETRSSDFPVSDPTFQSDYGGSQDAFVLELQVQFKPASVTAEQDHRNGPRLRAHPNPVTDGYLLLEASGSYRREGIRLELVDMLGRTVADLTGQFRRSAASMRVDLRSYELAPGLYFCRLSNETHQTAVPIVIPGR